MTKEIIQGILEVLNELPEILSWTIFAKFVDLIYLFFYKAVA